MAVPGRVLAYAASLVPGIGEDIAEIDAAMRLGYTWKFGPFELIDRLGGAWVAQRLAALGMEVPAILRALGDGKFYRANADGEVGSSFRRGVGIRRLSGHRGFCCLMM